MFPPIYCLVVVVVFDRLHLFINRYRYLLIRVYAKKKNFITILTINVPDNLIHIQNKQTNANETGTDGRENADKKKFPSLFLKTKIQYFLFFLFVHTKVHQTKGYVKRKINKFLFTVCVCVFIKYAVPDLNVPGRRRRCCSFPTTKMY